MVKSEDLGKKKDDIEDEDAGADDAPKKGETITVSKKSLEALYARLTALEDDAAAREERASGVPQSVFKRTKDKLIKTRYWDDKLVLKWTDKGVYEMDDPKKPGRDKREWYIDIVVQGVKEPISIKYLDYLNFSKVKYAKVIKTEIEEEIENFGAVNVKEEKQGRFTETDDVVPLDVKKEFRTYTVETEDGEELEISEKYMH